MKSLKKVENHQLLGEVLVRSKMPWMSIGETWDNTRTYAEVKRLFPYLCDDNDLRSEDGFTVKWKWYVRWAQNNLREKGILEKVNPDKSDGLWVKVRE